MIATTLGALANAHAALTRLAEIRLPIKLAYQIGRLIRYAAPEIADYQQRRDALVRQYGVPTPNGDQIAVAPEHLATFIEEMTQLAAIPVTLPVGYLSLIDLTVELTPADMIALMPFLADEQTNGETHS